MKLLKKKMFCYWYCPINIFIYQYLGALVPKSKYDQKRVFLSKQRVLLDDDDDDVEDDEYF